jgi:dolichol-phosphate mannosyltransferase
MSPGVRLSVVVPTYGEAQNLPVLVPRICAAIDDVEILIVDDDSPDDTVAVCAELANEYPVRLIVRKNERGLSSAVIRGFSEARGEVVLCMDADLSHPPEAIPALVEAVTDGGGDFVIGSRYVPGGSTDGDWGALRWLNSKAATLLARPLTGARDPMAGFFALRRETFQSAKQLSPIGYKIGLELIVKCRCKDVREVPIRFSDRLHGESKLSLKEQWNYVVHLRRLYIFRLGRAARPLQFVLVGSTGVVVDLTVFSLLLPVLPLRAARAVAIAIAMTSNFLLNRRLTFPHARSGSMPRQYVAFCASCLLGALVNWTLSTQLIQRVAFFADWKVLAALIGVIAGTAFNYMMSVRFVFRARPE